MRRPYFQARTKELEALFERHKDDVEELVVLLGELEHRSTPRAVALKDRVLKQLAAAKKAEVGRRDIASPSSLSAPIQPELPVATPTRAAGEVSTDRGNRVAQDLGQVPAPRHETSKIRKPGRLTDVPDARLAFTSNRIDLKLSPDAPLILKYMRSLECLVADMRHKKSGTRTVTVTNGCRISIDTGDYGYQFVFDGDEALFEGAAIVAEVAGRSCEGQIASVAEKRIIVSLRDDIGDEIEYCVLRIDNTAMIEALRKRLEEISRGEVTNFDNDIASAVIHNTGDEQPPTALGPTQTGRLPASQREAASKALSNSIFYLWGPPGTGKTFTLSILSDLLFEAKKKIFICSNTNQAVDQLLYKLCKELKPHHPAME